MSNNKHTTNNDKSVFTQSTVPSSTNQLRFNEIRGFMDKAAENFRRNQEMNKIYQQVMERKKQIALARAAEAAHTQINNEVVEPSTINKESSTT
jgi:hypothetical protein